jgi:hypothetical protein
LAPDEGIAGLYIAWVVAAGLLVFAAVERHPYSFYTLLRWICCPVFAYSAVAAHEKNRVLWVWVFGVLAGLYNPIFRVHLDRNTWIAVNWVTVGAIVVAIVVFLVREIKADRPLLRSQERQGGLRESDSTDPRAVGFQRETR